MKILRMSRYKPKLFSIEVHHPTYGNLTSWGIKSFRRPLFGYRRK